MDLIDIYGDNQVLDVVHNLAEYRREVEKMTKAVVHRLATVCADDGLQDRWATTVSVGVDGTSADFETPFGHARAELTLGIEDGEVQGFWNIWKRVYDETGQIGWSLVTTIRVFRSGMFFLGKGNQNGLRVYRDLTRDQDMTAYQVMGAILYAIGAH